MLSVNSDTIGSTTRSGFTMSPLIPLRSSSMMSLVFLVPSGFSLTSKTTVLATTLVRRIVSSLPRPSYLAAPPGG